MWWRLSTESPPGLCNIKGRICGRDTSASVYRVSTACLITQHQLGPTQEKFSAWRAPFYFFGQDDLQRPFWNIKAGHPPQHTESRPLAPSSNTSSGRENRNPRHGVLLSNSMTNMKFIGRQSIVYCRLLRPSGTMAGSRPTQASSHTRDLHHLWRLPILFGGKE